jgi:hypothetical protein
LGYASVRDDEKPRRVSVGLSGVSMAGLESYGSSPNSSRILRAVTEHLANGLDVLPALEQEAGERVARVAEPQM